MKRNSRKILQGYVVADILNKTISVLVKTYKNHPLYKKKICYSKKYLVHDENNFAHLGDKVNIMETKLFSKKKFFRLISVIEKSIKV